MTEEVATLVEAMITITDKGAEKINDFLAQQESKAETAGLRVGVRGGGCSGFQYALAFDVQRDGAEVDYVDGLQGAGFQVNNPNVIASCGCGSSFRVRDEEEVSAV
jgi:iron-sulfur cluster assembly protein